MITTPADRNPTATTVTRLADPRSAERGSRPYATPVLVELGRVEDLTRGADTGGPPEPVASGV